MSTIRRSSLASAICGIVFLCPMLAMGQGPQGGSEVTAIDILLNPDDTMLDRARADNARLRADYPKK